MPLHRRPCRSVALVLSVLAWSWEARASAPEDELDAERPGVLATFSAAGGSPARARRVSPDLGGHWALGAPDARVPADGFAGRWEGLLLIQSPGAHRFHARTDGEVELTVSGRVVLKGKGEPGEPIELRAGFTPIVLDYRHARGEAHVAIDWEGPGFGREPLPGRLLFHDPAGAAPPDRFEDGRRLADRLGCANCHALLDLPPHPDLGPPLIDAGVAIDAAWLDAWLRDPAGVRPRTRMPAYGPGFSPAEAADLRAFLASLAPRPAPVTAEARMALHVATPAQGQLLFRSAGCLGCHTRGEPAPGDRQAPDLADLSRKRSESWLAAYLGPAKASKTAVKHRPDLKLSVDEAANLAVYLVSGPTPAASGPASGPAGDPARGRALAERSRCASCHAIAGLAATRPAPPLAAGSRADGGCLAEGGQGPHVPRFSLTDDQRRALRELVAGLPRSPSPTAPATLADDSVRRLGCLGCHARDGRGGEDLGGRVAALLAQDPALGGLKGTLTPPNLTAVGDKLRPDYLGQSVRGAAPTARPWLSVRMPAFPFRPGEADAIVAAFQVHDRMRPEADPPPADARLDAATTETAATLIGQRGFGCVSCHVLAGRIPPGGEPETLGPDLALAHLRMPERYFHRWVANPQRIIPGTPMPQFLQPVATVPGTLEDQLATIWKLLGSRQVGEVAATGTREVLRRQGDRPLVVHDMVLVPGAPGTEYTPRALAIGLKNDHALLFDADRLTWLSWWHGGFLARTKSGRLWEWHPEGQRLWVAPNRMPPIIFLDPKRAPLLPGEVRERFGHLAEVDFEGSALALSYRLHGPEGARVEVRERIEPTATGWERSVAVAGVPSGFVPALLEHPPAASWSWTLGDARVTLEPEGAGPAFDPGIAGDPGARAVPMRPDGPQRFTARLRLKRLTPP